MERAREGEKSGKLGARKRGIVPVIGKQRDRRAHELKQAVPSSHLSILPVSL